MKKYDSYKDSGIEWIGEIPNHWNISRYRYFYFSNMGVTLLKEDVKEDGIYPVYSATETDVLFGYVDEASVILNEGDIVIPARGNSIGHIKVVTSPSTSTQTTIYSKKISQNIETNFVKYFLQGLREHLFQFDRTAIPQITVNQVKNNPLVIPPPEEQIAIAHYLDRKTAEIDELIADKKRLLELYEEEKAAIINQAVTKGINPDVPMKDSGIEWLGEIPEHWEIRRIKSISSHFKGFAFKSSDFELNGIPIVKASNIKKWQIVDITSFIAENNQRPEFEKVRLKKGDAILSTVGSKPDVINSAVGQLATVDKEFDNSYLNQNTLCIRPNEQVNDLFLKYTFLSKYFRANLDSISAWIANQAYLEVEDILSIQVILPLIEEQKDISTYLDAECASIDSKKAKTEKLIELLTEYRTALISEVVTGKIKVID